MNLNAQWFRFRWEWSDARARTIGQTLLCNKDYSFFLSDASISTADIVLIRRALKWVHWCRLQLGFWGIERKLTSPGETGDLILSCCFENVGSCEKSALSFVPPSEFSLHLHTQQYGYCPGCIVPILTTAIQCSGDVPLLTPAYVIFCIFNFVFSGISRSKNSVVQTAWHHEKGGSFPL